MLDNYGSILNGLDGPVNAKVVHPVRLRNAILEALMEDELLTFRSIPAIMRFLKSSSNIDIQEDHLKQVLEEMGKEGKVFRRSEIGDFLYGAKSRVSIETQALYFLTLVSNRVWNTVEDVAKFLDITPEFAEKTLYDVENFVVRKDFLNGSIWAATKRLEQEEGSLITRYLDPNTFTPSPCPSPSPDSLKSVYMHSYKQSPQRDLTMNIDRLPTTMIVKAISDAMAHSREVSSREHIKADRIERVNQFIVSLRRQFGYLDDTYRHEREFLSAQLARKEVWQDVGVLNLSKTGKFGIDTATALKYRDVESWLAQAEAMTPSFGDLKAEIEHSMERMKGSLLVAEMCNKTSGELNRDADKVLAEMAALAADM